GSEVIKIASGIEGVLNDSAMLNIERRPARLRGRTYQDNILSARNGVTEFVHNVGVSSRYVRQTNGCTPDLLMQRIDGDNRAIVFIHSVRFKLRSDYCWRNCVFVSFIVRTFIERLKDAAASTGSAHESCSITKMFIRSSYPVRLFKLRCLSKAAWA